MAGTETKRVGRPTKEPRTGQRNSLGLRVTADIKSRLDNAAKESGRSQSHEAELRLARSFSDEDSRDETLFKIFGGTEAYSLFHLAAAAAAVEQAHAKKPWASDPQTFDNALKAINTVLEAFRPKGRTKPVDAFTDVRARLLVGNRMAEGLGLDPYEAKGRVLEVDINTINLTAPDGSER